MMKQVASVSPEGIEWISSGLRSMARERKSFPSSTRVDKLLGFGPPHPTISESTVLDDLKEEDVWGEEYSTDEGRKEEHFYGAGKEITDSPETLRNFGSNNWRRLGAERESGRTRGLSSLSPHNRGTGTLSGHACSREGTPCRQSSASRMISLTGNPAGYAGRAIPHSAPVEVPDWSKIVGIGDMAKSRESYVADDDEDGERLPPHEVVARQYARSQITTFSVFEGAGRKLKGRDLSRVRNAVWRQTGFIE